MKQLLIIKLVICFGWLSSIAVAQLEITGAITGSVSFPHVGITCIGNLAVFITSLLRRRLVLENGARDILATILGPFKLEETYPKSNNGTSNAEVIKLATADPSASVLMLSNSAGMTNYSMRQFIKYVANAHNVHSIVVKYDANITPDMSQPVSPSGNCIVGGPKCNCIELRTVERIPMSELFDSEGLLPSLNCLGNGRHGCKPETVNSSNFKFRAACDALDFEFTTPSQKNPICICIPVPNDDAWTKLLVRSLKCKDQEDKGVIVGASDALQSYLDMTKEDRVELVGVDKESTSAAPPSYSVKIKKEDRDELVTYKTFPLMVIRLVEILINLLLTAFFKVDGFSSSLAARRAVSGYVVDSKGSGLPANVFLTAALVVVKPDSVCQVLKFRGNILGSRILLFMVGCVNLLCAIAWAVVLIAFNGGVGKWFEVPSMAPSKPRVAVIIAAICIGIGMDLCEFYNIVMRCFKNPKENWKGIWDEIINKRNLLRLAMILLEIGFAVVLGALDLNKSIGRWVYGALQLLVWVKWGIGSYLLGVYSPEYVPSRSKRDHSTDGGVILKYSSADWVDEGTWVYSSSFFLNAVMAGVMGNWAGIWSTWK